MKTCHACGQTLPFKAGNIVALKTARYRYGLVVAVPSASSRLAGHLAVRMFHTGELEYWNAVACERLHGYFRITERETL